MEEKKFKFNRPINIKAILKWLAIIIVLVASIITIYEEFIWLTGGYNEFLPGLDEEITDETAYNGDCNVATIKLHGELVTYVSNDNKDEENNSVIDQVSSEQLIQEIEDADYNPSIKAIILEIDSYGGSSVGAEEVTNTLKRASKPTVALIRGGGVSAGYYIATGADIIFASKNSDIGSIGVTMSYLDNVIKNTKEGLTYQQLSSGIYKDTGDPDKPLTNAEKTLLMRDILIMNDNFIKVVAENRNLDIEKVRKLADGSSMMGEMALENGLIDKIGGIYEAQEYLKEKTGEEVIICK